MFIVLLCQDKFCQILLVSFEAFKISEGIKVYGFVSRLSIPKYDIVAAVIRASVSMLSLCIGWLKLSRTSGIFALQLLMTFMLADIVPMSLTDEALKNISYKTCL